MRSRRASVDRVAAILLVAGQHDLDVGVLQRPGGLHRAQRGDHDHHAALVVADAGPLAVVAVAGRSAGTGESGSNTVSRWPISSIRLPRPLPLWVATRWPARPVSAIGDPPHREAERLELGAHHRADRLDAGEVQRAAILVHQFPASRRCAPARHRRSATIFCSARGELRRRARRRVARKRPAPRRGKSGTSAAA